MRKLFTVAAALTAFAFSARSQVEYCLPMTTLKVEVSAVKETFFAGPYAAFAEKYLGMQVREADSEKTILQEITVTAMVGADLSAVYTAPSSSAAALLTLSPEGLVAFREKTEAEDALWRYRVSPEKDFQSKGLTLAIAKEKRTVYKVVQTDSTYEQIPVQQEVEVRKSMDEKAREAADMLLSARREQFNIATGNTDATFSGEALGSALNYLQKVEKEYLSLFTGYTVREPMKRTFFVEPVPEMTTVPVFRISDEEGILDVSQEGDRTYYMDIQTGEVPESEPFDGKSKGGFIYYRIPAPANIVITDGTSELLSARFPIYQSGRVSKYPITK